jgi:hypothetical protein
MTTHDTQAKERKEAYATLLAHFLRTFECDAGRSVLACLHATAGTRASSFHPGANGAGMDALAAAKRDGGKTLVWFIEDRLTEARLACGSPPADKPATTGGTRARR